MTTETLPLLPLRDVVVFPQMVIPLFVGREKSINALEAAMSEGRKIILATQQDAAEDDPSIEGLYPVGTLANVLQILRLPDATLKVLVEGEARVQLLDTQEESSFVEAKFRSLTQEPIEPRDQDALLKELLSKFETYVNMSKKIPNEVYSSLSSMTDLSRLCDTVATHINLSTTEKQNLLSLVHLPARVEHLLGLLDSEADLVQLERKIRTSVKKQMEKTQRDYFLNEQLKAIHKELGNEDQGDELINLQQRIKEARMPAEAQTKANQELAKLKQMSPMSAEASVVRNYLDWLLGVPWNKRSRLKHDLQQAQNILDEDHYGLEEVKERILEYLAVQQRVKKVRGSVLCLVGPPGVGKTSLAKSIARATNRQFVRMALGGVRDESEIRGHRKTYIGSMPGRPMQKLSKVGVRNPLFLLDEIDKMGMDHRGDPASALLEVLDPEQNGQFNDHYLEVDYDLSEVMFICTSNSMNIPGPLLDRMEIIRIPGYTEQEKLNIAKRYLLSKQQQAAGLAKDEMQITDQALLSIIRLYTREAGVRGLDRQIAKLARKVVKQHLLAKSKSQQLIALEDLQHYLGSAKFRFGLAEEHNQIGQVTGLAWTSVGGEILTLETAVIPGKGQLVRTGSLGDVMQESITAAMTVVRARAQSLGLSPDFHQSLDVHIHVPEGATPKDGPSAGIGMCTALVSALTKIPVRSDVAMTGEITLRGQVLAIGGLKEKLLAALRAGIKTVIIPKENEKDLLEIPEQIKSGLSICPVDWIDQVLAIALERVPNPLTDQEVALLREGSDSDSEKSSTGAH